MQVVGTVRERLRSKQQFFVVIKGMSQYSLVFYSEDSRQVNMVTVVKYISPA